jgi:uncharacterized protein YggE
MRLSLRFVPSTRSRTQRCEHSVLRLRSAGLSRKPRERPRLRHRGKPLVLRKLLLALTFAASVSVAVADDTYVQVTTEKTNRIVLRSVGEAQAPADYTLIQFCLTATNEDAKDAHKTLYKRVDVLKNTLDLPEIAPVTSFAVMLHVDPEAFSYSSCNNNYTYMSKITLKLDKIQSVSDRELHTKIANLLDQLTELDVPGSLICVTYGVDHPDDLNDKASELAVRNAKEKAKPLARASGRKLGKITMITDLRESVKSSDPYAITDTSSNNSIVTRKAVIVVEFVLE